MNSHVVEVPNWQTSMTIGFQQLLQNGDLCDVTLEGNDGMDIRCHSVILAAASPYFRNTLVWTREDFHIKIGSISSTTWKCIVEFIYCGRIIFDSQNAMEILMITKKLGLKDLHSAIQDYLKKFGINDDFAVPEPRSIESDSLLASISPPTPEAHPPPAPEEEETPNSEQPELSPIITHAYPLGNSSPVEMAAQVAEAAEAAEKAARVQAESFNTRTDNNINGQAHGVNVDNGVGQPEQPDQLSFFQGLGLQAQKLDSEKDSPDTEPQIRQSKRLGNSGKKMNFRELDGRRQNNQSGASPSERPGNVQNEPVGPMLHEGEMIDGEFIEYGDGADGKQVMFTCKFCYRVFPNRSLLCKHKAKWHAKSQKSKGKKAHKTFWCKLCNISFRAPSALYKHKKDFHPEIINKRNVIEDFGDAEIKAVKEDNKEEPVTNPVTELSTVMPKQFTCKLCDEIYPDRHSLYQHKMEEHYVKRPVGRPKGMKYTPVPVKKSGSNKPRGAFFKCKKCFKAFTNPGSLRWHKCAAASNLLPEGVTPIMPPGEPASKVEEESGQEPGLTNGNHPITGDEGITPIKPKIEITDAGDAPLDLSTKNPGAGMSYRCDECQKIFSSLILVRWHKTRCTVGRQDEQGVIKPGSTATGPGCNVCHKVFKTPGYLQWHLSRRHGIRMVDSAPNKALKEGEPAPGLECKICFRTFPHKKYLKEHMKSEHGGRGENRCHLCHKSFSRRYYLAHHIRKVHEGFTPLRCEVCKKAFITKTRLVRHLNIFHDIQVSEDQIYYKDEERMPIKVKPKELKPKPMKSNPSGIPGMYACEHCPRRFTHPHHLARHTKATHATMSIIFSCEKCSQQFSSERLLLAHMDKEHADEEDELSDQDVKIPGMIALPGHDSGIMSYNEDSMLQASTSGAAASDDFICGICGGSFSTESSLRDHVKQAHEHPQDDEIIPSPTKSDGKGPVECPHCFKRLTSRSILTQHIRTVHEGVRNYECSICHKKFAQKHHLARHVFLHGGVRPFECQICQKRFITNYSLVSHTKMAHKDMI